MYESHYNQSFRSQLVVVASQRGRFSMSYILKYRGWLVWTHIFFMPLRFCRLWFKYLQINSFTHDCVYACQRFFFLVRLHWEFWKVFLREKKLFKQLKILFVLFLRKLLTRRLYSTRKNRSSIIWTKSVERFWKITSESLKFTIFGLYF